jgi:hypothetical protein
VSFLHTGRDPVVLGDLVVDAKEDRLFLGGDVGAAESAFHRLHPNFRGVLYVGHVISFSFCYPMVPLGMRIHTSRHGGEPAVKLALVEPLPDWPMSRQILRSLASQLVTHAILIEADDPLAPDLDHRHPRLLSLAHDAARGVRVAFYVDLLEGTPGPVLHRLHPHPSDVAYVERVLPYSATKSPGIRRGTALLYCAATNSS